VPKDEFKMRARKESIDEEIVEKTIYVIKPILVPVEAMATKGRTRNERQWKIYN